MTRRATPSLAQKESRWATTLDITQTVFTTVKNISEVIPAVPFLKETAGLACGLLTIIDCMKQNNDGFEELAGRAFEVIYVVHSSISEYKDWSDSMERNLKHLMERSRKFAEIKVKKGVLSRICHLNADKGKIVQFEKRLDQALGLFNVVASIETHANLRKIQRDLPEVRSEATDLELDVEDAQDRLPSLASESDKSYIPETPSTNPSRCFDSQFRGQNQKSSPPPSQQRISILDGASGLTIGGSVSVSNVSGNQTNYSNSNNSSPK
ncbi:hypothetical protein AAF712_013517 [Marasmius tenuissimus]|uniref:Fungal N-terminal domain-containing protein n=1 Tax=Marasmius tenuissimus TaxID=585030 RepID=A0ABR2ZDI7_9AGAR